MESFQQALRSVKVSFEAVRKTGFDAVAGGMHDFKQQRAATNKQSYERAIEVLAHAVNTLPQDQREEVSILVNRLSGVNNPDTIAALLFQIEQSVPVLAKDERIFVPGVSEQVEADVCEMNQCFEHGLYRSAVILCGRILETALHRKYFEVTGNDLLEKSPGMGLGNLIAKLAEHNVPIDPGLGNQIHLINQVRIHSVHQKQTPFLPSADQTRAIMLYTMDVVRKLFSKT